MLFPLLETSFPGSLYSWVLLSIKPQTGLTTLPHLQLTSLIPLEFFLSPFSMVSLEALLFIYFLLRDNCFTEFCCFCQTST